MLCKLKQQSEPKKFEPVILEITIESEEEGRALYAVFNHTDNSLLLGHDIYRALSRFATRYGSQITNRVSYNDWYGDR